MLNSYGYTYVRLYAGIEEKYENGGESWFDRTGKQLTKEEAKEKELEELNKGYEGAVEWAEMMTNRHGMKWDSISEPVQNPDKSAQEIPKPGQKDLEEMKRAFYEARDRYMKLYKECKQTGNLLTRQDYIFGHNALLSFLAKTWGEYKHE